MQRSIGELLAHHDAFRGLARPDLDLVAGCGHNTVFEAGQYLFREGETAETFYVVREGRIALEMFVPDRGPLVVDTVETGDITGVSWLFPPYRWQFDGRAVELTRVVSFDGACLRRKCDADPRLGYELMKRFAMVISRRMSSAHVRLADLYGSARAR